MRRTAAARLPARGAARAALSSGWAAERGRSGGEGGGAAEDGTGAAPRRTLSLTPGGRAELLARLRSPKDAEITDGQRFFTVLTFLGLLPDPAAQAAVLRRRQAFLLTPASFFYEDGAPATVEAEPDLFRRGMLRVARATGTEEKAWLAEALAELDARTAGPSGTQAVPSGSRGPGRARKGTV